MERRWQVLLGCLVLGVAASFAAGAFVPPAGAQARYVQTKQKANENTVTVISGGISGTYIRFATDLANVLDDVDNGETRVLPIIGRGGGQNVKDILYLRGIDMGIAQTEHLEYFRKRDPGLYGNIQNRLRYITKLYNSEFHLVAGPGIKTFEDLKGKTVNLWKTDSATDIAGQIIFKTLGIDVKFTHYDTQLALEKIRTGEVAATSLLAGAPIGGYAKLTKADNMHFVPLDEGSLPKGKFAKLLDLYLPTKLTSDEYPELIPAGESVPTVASGAVLAVYNWAPDTERYRKLANFVNVFFSNFSKFLQEPRHPKWKEVNLAADIPGWTRFAPAQQWLDTHDMPKVAAAKAGEDETQALSPDDVESFLKSDMAQAGGRPLSNAQKQELIRHFKTWMKTDQ